MAHPSPHSKINGAWRKSVNIAKSVSGHKTKQLSALWLILRERISKDKFKSNFTELN